MGSKFPVADGSMLTDARTRFTLTMGKALALSFGIAIGIASVVVALGVLISQ